MPLSRSRTKARDPEPYPWTVPIDPARPHGSERVLGLMAAAVIGVSLLALVVVLILGAVRADLGAGVFPVLALLPLIGFPIGVLFLIAFIIVSGTRRMRAAERPRNPRDAGR